MVNNSKFRYQNDLTCCVQFFKKKFVYLAPYICMHMREHCDINVNDTKSWEYWFQSTIVFNRIGY